MAELKKKILFLVQLPPPVHGVSVTNKKVVDSRRIAEEFDVGVLPLLFSKSIDQIDKLSVTKVINTFKIAVRLIRECVKNRPNIVYFTLSIIGNTFYRDVLYVFILKAFGVNIVYHLHRVGVMEAGNDNRVRDMLYRWVFSDAYVIHLTPRLYADIERYVASDRCYFVSNGIDDHSKNAICGVKSDENDGVIRFSFLSHMVAEKGVLVLLEALELLKKRGLKFSAVFAGGRMSDDCRKALMRFDESVDNEQSIEYIGPVYDEAKSEFFKNTDVFVFPTLYDSFGIVLLEAMSYGKPVVSTIQGGIPDIVENGINGYIVKCGDHIALADRMEELALDESKRTSMGREGRLRYENEFTSDVFEDNLVEVLKQCVSSTKNNRL